MHMEACMSARNGARHFLLMVREFLLKMITTKTNLWTCRWEAYMLSTTDGATKERKWKLKLELIRTLNLNMEDKLVIVQMQIHHFMAWNQMLNTLICLQKQDSL